MSSIPSFVVLQDGPVTLERVRTAVACVTADSERVVVAHCGKNEHFTPTGRTEVVNGVSAPVYAWSYTTAIAE
ncbi:MULTISPECIES: DUF5988 family protein [unclassified Streptomyces]|uniref:DUF5988 family protein n=1 Tax=Streptomyces TaxID=1883 RepID=UPI000B5016FC|nr:MULTISPECIES: DUF5988 family protein [unclassified Streptomyces]MYX00749.1 hypothetical protein [Streptomyces sp. SID8378]SNB90458.1 hypothetical protein SAMN02745831_06762 [Streptomyces sp. PgraA7]